MTTHITAQAASILYNRLRAPWMPTYKATAVLMRDMRRKGCFDHQDGKRTAVTETHVRQYVKMLRDENTAALAAMKAQVSPEFIRMRC